MAVFQSVICVDDSNNIFLLEICIAHCLKWSPYDNKILSLTMSSHNVSMSEKFIGEPNGSRKTIEEELSHGY